MAGADQKCHISVKTASYVVSQALMQDGFRALCSDDIDFDNAPVVLLRNYHSCFIGLSRNPLLVCLDVSWEMLDFAFVANP